MRAPGGGFSRRTAVLHHHNHGDELFLSIETIQDDVRNTTSRPFLFTTSDPMEEIQNGILLILLGIGQLN
jgi:hypothetical protein